MRTRQVDDLHIIIEDVEALLKRQRQQKSGQQLHTGLHNTQLLKQAGPVAIQPFSFGLVPTVVRALGIHRAIVSPALPVRSGFRLIGFTQLPVNNFLGRHRTVETWLQ